MKKFKILKCQFFSSLNFSGHHTGNRQRLQQLVLWGGCAGTGEAEGDCEKERCPHQRAGGLHR